MNEKDNEVERERDREGRIERELEVMESVRENE